MLTGISFLAINQVPTVCIPSPLESLRTSVTPKSALPERNMPVPLPHWSFYAGSQSPYYTLLQHKSCKTKIFLGANECISSCSQCNKIPGTTKDICHLFFVVIQHTLIEPLLWGPTRCSCWHVEYEGPVKYLIYRGSQASKEKCVLGRGRDARRTESPSPIEWVWGEVGSRAFSEGEPWHCCGILMYTVRF